MSNYYTCGFDFKSITYNDINIKIELHLSFRKAMLRADNRAATIASGLLINPKPELKNTHA